ncbi:hypothetical protein GJAV_G00225980 [Gymnothorax javanicus]|nr:hypothetical protein GJAV_G00225980 [Gymnothorax javanicus]
MDDCGRASKCFLILFNIIIAIVGFMLLSLGLWLRFSSETRGFFDIDLSTQQFVIGVSVLIVVGIVLVILALVGHCGACNGSRGALNAYAILLALLLGVIIAAGVLAYINSDQVGDQLVEFYKSVYLQYLNKGDPSLATTLKLFHNALHCCGIGVPLEVLIQDTCPNKGLFDLLRTPQCPKAIEDLFRDNAPVVLGSFLGIAVVMFFAIICARVLSKAIARERTTYGAYVRLLTGHALVYGSM